MTQEDTLEARRLLESYCRDGDRGSFDRFYRRQSPRLWRFLRFRGVSEDAAYDLVAETFLRFIQVICKDPRSPVALLYRIATNLKIDAWRRRRHEQDGSEDRPAAYSESEEQVYLRRLIARLPESEQNLLLMRYWIGLTHREIAELTGDPAGTVRRRTAELLEELRELWAGDVE